MSIEIFWVVWNPIGRNPVVRHKTEKDATNEANRLARNNPGQEFVVLQSKRSCVTTTVTQIEHVGDYSRNYF